MRKLFLIPLLALAIIPSEAFNVSQAEITYCLRQWEWAEDGPTDMAWIAPDEADVLGLIDLRIRAEAIADGPAPKGQGIFAYSKAPVLNGGDLACFSGGLGGNLHSLEKVALEQAMKFESGEFNSSSSLTDALWRILTTKSDIEGKTGIRPIMPGSDGKLKIYLGGQSPIREEKFVLGVHPHSGQVLANLQNDYRDLREDTLAALLPPDHHRRVLDYWTDKYQTDDFQQFIPSGLPVETPMMHATIITEDWDCSDSTPGDIDCDLTWVGVGTDTTCWEILSLNIIIQDAGGSGDDCYEYTTSTLSTDDHYVEIVLEAIVDDGSNDVMIGAFARKTADSTIDGYRWRGRRGATDRNRLTRKDNDASSVLCTDTGTLAVATDVFRVEVDGSTITGLINDVIVCGPATNGDITGNVNTAFYGFMENTSNFPEADDFEAGDLAVVARRVFTFWPF